MAVEYYHIMRHPCSICCVLPCMKNPPDAEKLSEDEAKVYIDDLQGTYLFFV